MHFPVCNPEQPGLQCPYCAPCTHTGPPEHSALSHTAAEPSLPAALGRSCPRGAPEPGRYLSPRPRPAPGTQNSGQRSPLTTTAATPKNHRPGRTAGARRVSPGGKRGRSPAPPGCRAAALPPNRQSRSPGGRSGAAPAPGMSRSPAAAARRAAAPLGRSPPAAGPAGAGGAPPPAAISSPRGPGRARLWRRSAAVGVQRPGRAPKAAGVWWRCLVPLGCSFAFPSAVLPFTQALPQPLSPGTLMSVLEVCVVLGYAA